MSRRQCAPSLAFCETRRPRTRYKRWARALRPADTVITFNYNLVVEKLVRAQNDAYQKGKGVESTVRVVVPGSDPADWKSGCPVFKLHGSVDWKLHNGVTTREDERFALICDDDALAIATPGPSKKRTAESFQELWEHAVEALKEAEAIVFVGFRFPPTDSDAREKLLGAVRENRREGLLNVHDPRRLGDPPVWSGH